MASFVAKIVSKKILGETVKNKFGKEDPYFESVPATRLGGKPSTNGKVKKRKKALPPGISEHDGQVLTKVKRRAYRLDMSLFSFAGMHFGWGTVIGFVPGIGDALDAFMALMVLKTCCQIEGGLPNAVKSKMMFNIVFDFFIGLVPFLGDLADAMYRANTKNALLLEQHLREQGQKNLRQSGLPAPRYDPSDPDYFDRVERGDIPRSRGPSREPSTEGAPRTQQPMPSAPEPAYAAGGKGSWFGRNKPRQHDVEMGEVDRRSQRQQQRNGRS